MTDEIEAWLRDQEDWFHDPDGVDKEFSQLISIVRVYREANQQFIKHEETTLTFEPDIHRHNGYRANTYWKARSADAKALEIIGGDGK